MQFLRQRGPVRVRAERRTPVREPESLASRRLSAKSEILPLSTTEVELYREGK